MLQRFPCFLRSVTIHASIGKYFAVKSIAMDSATVARIVDEKLAAVRGEFEARLAAFERRLQHFESTLASADVHRVGDVVRIEGLDNVSHLNLNGKKAKLRSWEGPGGRWVVQVLQTGELKSLKHDNLINVISGVSGRDGLGSDSVQRAAGIHCHSDGGGGLCKGDVVEIRGLRRANQLNGARGEILSWDDDGGRWVVRLTATGQRRRLRTCNLRRVGEAVRVPKDHFGAKRPRADVAADEIEPGLLVRLHGLSGAKALNGALGRVQRMTDGNRWIVRLLGSAVDGEKSFRPENLTVVGASEGTNGQSSVRAGQVARVRNFSADEDLNGLRCEIISWNADSSAWSIRMLETDELRSIPPENLDTTSGGGLRAGQDAIIEGLEKVEALNGRLARLMQWSAADGRWLVRVGGSSGEEKRLRPRRLLAVARETAVTAEASNQEVVSGVDSTVKANTFSGEEDDMLGGSSSDENQCDDGVDVSEQMGASGDLLREGARVVLSGGWPGTHDGQVGTLIRWEDVGGPFGQWIVDLATPGTPKRELSVNPAYLSLASQVRS
eukprot:TRINITY_DN65519_c0_g1_i1.p1 TRINITY_DN65519_c0_g1~~TRINITY_DN65519_c0_g1_i1.p1  ORF type:complete len:554 (-),score=60.60 TRINITY_DN65519_c0_g1_i1:349-2010(-)